MADYTFTHVSNANFTTRITLTDGAVGVVNWQVSFIRANTSWTSYNLNTVTNRPNFNFALGGVGFSGFYTYDFRTAGLERNIGSGSINVTPGAALSLTGTNDPVGSMGTATASGTFTTQPWPTPSWSTTSPLATATRGTAYSASVSASPVTSYSLISSSGQVDGLSFSGNTISGTPTTVGTANFTIRAFNNSSSADRAFSFTINPATPVFSDSSVVSTGIVGTAYSDSVSASETASYSVFSGALPGGLSLNTSTGAITGTPTTPGIFTFVIRATNVTGTANTGTLTITVTSGGKVWNGTAFVAGNTKVWSGSAWTTSTTKVWNGSSWVSAT
jgi:hypothetical protein